MREQLCLVLWYCNGLTCKIPDGRHGACLKLELLNSTSIVLNDFPKHFISKGFWFVCVGV